MHERPAVSLQALHNESLATEQTDSEAALECNADAHALSRRKKGILLRDQFPSDLRQMHGDDLPGRRRSKGHLPLAVAAIQEHGHEQGLSGEQALSRAHQGSHETRILLRAVA